MQSHQNLTLDRYLRERGPLDPVRAGKLALQVALQMSAAGESFLIHPGRILVGKDGSVRLLPPPAEDLALPPMVEFPAYASPEEIRGGRADIRSGLYALGCTLFELVTGKTPYPGKDPKEILRMHLELAVPEPRGVAGPIPPGLAETIKDLLAKDPDLRIQTPDELARRLRLAMGGGAPAAPAAAPAPRKAQAAASAPRTAARHAPGRLHRAAARQPARRLPAARASHGSYPAARHGDLDEDGDEAPAVERPDPKRSYTFTITGAVLGLLIGGVLILQALERRKAEPAVAEEAAREELLDELRKRKSHFVKNEADVKAHIDRVIADARKRPVDDRREYLMQHLTQYSGTRWGHILASEVVKLGPAPKSKATRAEEAESDKTYAALKAEAEKLRDAGRLGDSIEKIMEGWQDHKARHDAEITAFVEALSKELTEKWEAAKKEIDRLVEAGEIAAAEAALRKAEEYGDGPIRREVIEKLEGIQARSATVAAEKENPGDEDAPVEKTDEDPPIDER
jgi:hypothetical protein